MGLFIGIAIGVLVIIMAIILAIFFLRRRRHRRRQVAPSGEALSITSRNTEPDGTLVVGFGASTENLIEGASPFANNSRPASVVDSPVPNRQDTSELFPPEKRINVPNFVDSAPAEPSSGEGSAPTRGVALENPFFDPTDVDISAPNIDMSRLYEDERAFDLALVEFLARRMDPPRAFPPSYGSDSVRSAH